MSICSRNPSVSIDRLFRDLNERLNVARPISASIIRRESHNRRFDPNFLRIVKLDLEFNIKVLICYH